MAKPNSKAKAVESCGLWQDLTARGVAGPKTLGGTHVTLKNEYENSFRINFLP